MKKELKSKNKVVFISCVVVLVLVVGYFTYRKFTPDFQIGKFHGGRDDYYSESFVISLAGNPTKKQTEKALQIRDWYDEVSMDLESNYSRPHRVTVSGEVQNGKTALRYEGWITDENGTKQDVYIEKTFDFVLDKVLFDK